MSVVGTVRVTCPQCKTPQDAPLVQSINARQDPENKAKLLAGQLNVLACTCGKRTQLAATVLYFDPEADFTCQVVLGDDAAVAEAITLFGAMGVTGRRRVVPSLNALMEKVKLLDAGLDDWAIEMMKVLLLASRQDPDLNRVLLFEEADRDAQRLHWIQFDERLAPVGLTSPLAAYDKVVARASSRPPLSEARIDRVWAINAVRAMIADGN